MRIEAHKKIMATRRAAGVCCMCGGKLAYPGALQCGAACTARYESGELPINLNVIPIPRERT